MAHSKAILAGMSDATPAKPEPPTEQAKPGGVISLADRDEERRHEAARRLAEKHNAALRPQAPEDARVLINAGICVRFWGEPDAPGCWEWR